MNTAKVIAVHKSAEHNFSKPTCESIKLIAGIGIEGDAHSGYTVQHLSRVAKGAEQPNLRQVHLIHGELHEELKQKGFDVKPGEMGENITTHGIDLLNLPQDTILKIGTNSQIKITGLRTPCSQLDKFQKGLMKALLDKDAEGNLIRKAGVMAVVIEGGEIKSNDPIEIELPPLPHVRLEPV